MYRLNLEIHEIMCNPSNNMDFAVSIVLGIGVVKDFAVSIVLGIGVVNTNLQFYGGDQI
jgi:hypothetical protein